MHLEQVAPGGLNTGWRPLWHLLRLCTPVGAGKSKPGSLAVLAGCCWLPSHAGGVLPEQSLQSQWTSGSSGVHGPGVENSSNGPSSYKDPSRTNFRFSPRETHSCSRAYKYFPSLTLYPRVLIQHFSTNAHVCIFELWCWE